VKTYLGKDRLTLVDDNERMEMKDEYMWYSIPDAGYGALEEAVGKGEQLEMACLLLQSELLIDRVHMDAITVAPVQGQRGTFRRTGLARLSTWNPNNKGSPEWVRQYQKWTREGLQQITLI
jgi:hypothetical protein